MVRVEIDRLYRKFPDGTNIGPINLTVEDGEMLSLLGPSGSGKTTTLRMVAGFIAPDGGALRFDGIDVIKKPPRERKIGMVVQSVALFPNMSVYQNIAFALDVAGWEQKPTVERVEELADIVGVKNLLHRRVSEISGGEGQRIALARALALEPQLLLLDEPMSALDPTLRQRLQREIRDIQKRLEITTIYVTHSQSEAFAISDSIAVLENGVISQVGKPHELYENPLNAFVATFIGGGRLLRGKVIDKDNRTLEVAIGHSKITVDGDIPVGTNIILSVKPEDVQFTEEGESSVEVSVVDIKPQVGHFLVTLDLEGQQIVSEIQGSLLDDRIKPGERFHVTIDGSGVDII